MKRVTAEDLWVMAQAMWGEARGEGTDGLGAVALVIWNRSQDSRWARFSIAGICRQAWQFSVWNVGDPNRTKMLALSLDDNLFCACLRMALDVLTGAQADYTHGATHYYAETIASPYWAEGHEPVAHIGHHLFFAGIA